MQNTIELNENELKKHLAAKESDDLLILFLNSRKHVVYAFSLINHFVDTRASQ